MIKLKMKVVEITVRENGASTVTLEAIYDDTISPEERTHEEETFSPFRVVLPIQNAKLGLMIQPGQEFLLSAELLS